MTKENSKGRSPIDGRFQPGNKIAKGNQELAITSRFRRDFLASVTAEDGKKALDVLRRGLDHDDPTVAVAAASELLARMCGKPTAVKDAMPADGFTLNVTLTPTTAANAAKDQHHV